MKAETSFEAVMKMYVETLSDDITVKERRAAVLGFAAGMQAGAAVLQNRMAITTMEVARQDVNKDVLPYLVSTAMQAQVELDKLNMDISGVQYGQA